MISPDLACKRKDFKLRFERHLWLSTDCSPDSSVLSEPSEGLPPGCCLFTLTVCLLSVSVRLDVSECVGCARLSCAFVDLVYLYSPGDSPAARLWQGLAAAHRPKFHLSNVITKDSCFFFFISLTFHILYPFHHPAPSIFAPSAAQRFLLYAVTCYIHTLMCSCYLSLIVSTCISCRNI